jgi:hypothetical protein
VLYPPSKRADITFVAEMPAERRKTMSADERLLIFPRLALRRVHNAPLSALDYPRPLRSFPFRSSLPLSRISVIDKSLPRFYFLKRE